MASLIYPLLCIFAGSFFLYRNIRMLKEDGKLREYLEKSPKAKLWINKLGMEKTISLSKKYFLPLGCIVAATLLSVGIWSLSVTLIST
jgi:hypothetical protein